MVMEKLQKGMKDLYRDVKSGRATEEVADEISGAIDNVEELGDKAKEKFDEMMSGAKRSVNKIKNKN